MINPTIKDFILPREMVFFKKKLIGVDMGKNNRTVHGARKR